MKTAICVVLFSLLAGAPLVAQAPANDFVDALRSPGWNAGFFLGGSQSFANKPSAQSLVLAGRFGRVLTHEVGDGALRGSFEMAVDLIPLNEFWIHGAQYAGGLDPFIAKWNFTGGETVAPYIAAVGGVLFSTHNLPPGNTAQVNFTSGAELGLQWFHCERRSVNFAAKVYHLSNASIGTKNPGINGAVQFMVGYTWH